MVGINSAILWPNGKIYFFSGNYYYAYTPNLLVQGPAGSVDAGYPKLIDPSPGQQPRYWDTLVSGFQGAIVWPQLIDGKTKAYFFKDDQVYRYDVATDNVDPGYPRSTRLEWPSLFLPGPQNLQVDAAIAWPLALPPLVEGKVYFFQGGQYYTYKLTGNILDNRSLPTGTPEGPPKLISAPGGWQGLWWTSPHLDGCFPWPTPINNKAKAFFFQNDLFVQVDLDTRSIDHSPKAMQTWPGMPP